MQLHNASCTGPGATTQSSPSDVSYYLYVKKLKVLNFSFFVARRLWHKQQTQCNITEQAQKSPLIRTTFSRLSFLLIFECFFAGNSTRVPFVSTSMFTLGITEKQQILVFSANLASDLLHIPIQVRFRPDICLTKNR